MKIAIVGIGHWGKNLLREFDKQAEVIWVCHKDSLDSIKFLKENYPNIKSTNSLEEILRDPVIMAVVVATPTSTHFEIAQKVLTSNKHLFLEKPGCSNSSELEVLVKEAQKRNLKFAVGYEFVHHPALKKIRELIKIENMQSLRFEWDKWGTFKAPIVSNLLSHDISIIKSMGINSLILKKCRKQKILSATDIIDIEFENDENIHINSHVNRVSINKNKSALFIGKEKSYIWNNDNLFEINAAEQTFSPIEIGNANSVAEEIKDFLESIEKNKTPLTDGTFSLAVWQILNEIGI